MATNVASRLINFFISSGFMKIDDFVVVLMTKKEREFIDDLAEQQNLATYELCYNILKEKLKLDGDKHGAIVSKKI